jgi:chemotaxis protein MotA
LALGVLAIVLGVLNGGRLRMFWDLPSMFITIFSSFFAVVISFTLTT